MFLFIRTTKYFQLIMWLVDDLFTNAVLPFLSNHLIMATRTSGGKLHLMATIGKVPLQETILIEDPSDQQLNPEDDGGVEHVFRVDSSKCLKPNK